MNKEPANWRVRSSIRTQRRRAISSFEVLVACTLLTSLLSLSLSLLVRHGRLLTAQRHYRLALDELSNQLDRLTGLPTNELRLAVNQLTVSPFTAERLPGATLSGDLTSADMGQRVMLHLTSDEPYGVRVSMAGWVIRSQPLAGEPPGRGR